MSREEKKTPWLKFVAIITALALAGLMIWLVVELPNETNGGTENHTSRPDTTDVIIKPAPPRPDSTIIVKDGLKIIIRGQGATDPMIAEKASGRLEELNSLLTAAEERMPFIESMADLFVDGKQGQVVVHYLKGNPEATDIENFATRWASSPVKKYRATSCAQNGNAEDIKFLNVEIHEY